MTVTWHQEYEGGRIVARAGRIDIGAVFPPCGGGRWRWRFFLGPSIAGPEGETKTDLAARNALLGVWTDFLARAELSEAA